MKARWSRAWRALAAPLLAAALGAAGAQADAAGGSDAGLPDIELGGRLQLQHDVFDGVYSEAGRRREASYLRRARIEGSGRLPAELGWEVDVDLVPGEGAQLKTAVLQWRKPARSRLRLGRFDPDFGLEQASSSNWTLAIERSAIWDLAGEVADIGKGHGLEFARQGRRSWLSVGVYDKRGAQGLVARAAFAVPAAQARGARVLHLGLSLAAERLDDEDGRLRTRLGVRGVSEDAGGRRSSLAAALPGAARYTRQQLAVLEFAATSGPWSLQAEHLHRRLSGAVPARVASAQYLQLAWTLSGEARSYDLDGARFGRIAPRAAYGALELVVRLDWLQARGQPGLLGDAARTRARVQLLGVNWYLDKTWRVSANLLRARGTAGAGAPAVGDALSLRLQARF